MGELTFKCKYCKANTTHIFIQDIERQAIKGQLYKCLVCGFSKFLYRKEGKIVTDQSEVPERTIAMPHDLESIQTEIVSEEQEKTNKEIDEWLKNPNHYPVTQRGKKR
jgi:hypothetical protein